MSADGAILPFGEAAATAAAQALEALAPGGVQLGAVAVVEVGEDPFAGIQAPTVAVSVAYPGRAEDDPEGVAGGNVLVLPIAGARRLAGAVTGTEPPAVGAELSEAEHAAVCTAMNRMMAAVAGATAGLLGWQPEMTEAVTQLLVGPGGSDAACARTPNALTIGISFLGESLRLVQFVPDEFVAKLGGSVAGRGAGQIAHAGHAAPPATPGTAALRDVKLRVWAELGRARLPVGRAVGLGRGSVVELDREVDDPVDVYANGHRIGTGRLLLVDDGEWAVQIEQLFTAESRDAGREAA